MDSWLVDAMSLTPRQTSNMLMLELMEGTGTSLSLQNDELVGTISFHTVKLKDKAIEQHKKDSSSRWKTWEVTDDFSLLTVLYDYGCKAQDGKAEVE